MQPLFNYCCPFSYCLDIYSDLYQFVAIYINTKCHRNLSLYQRNFIVYSTREISMFAIFLQGVILIDKKTDVAKSSRMKRKALFMSKIYKYLQESRTRFLAHW